MWKELDANTLGETVLARARYMLCASNCRVLPSDNVSFPDALRTWEIDCGPKWSKRLRAWLWEEHGIKAGDSNDAVSFASNVVGGFAESEPMQCQLVDKMDWKAGDYGDHGSCFWQGHIADRIGVSRCKEAGAVVIRSAISSRGTARCIFYKLWDWELNEHGFDSHAIVLTNGYGLATRKIANGMVNGNAFGEDMEIVDISGTRAGIYLNQDQVLLARRLSVQYSFGFLSENMLYFDLATDALYVPFLSTLRAVEDPVCHECDECFDEADIFPAFTERGLSIDVCRACRDEKYGQCPVCNDWFPRDVQVNHQRRDGGQSYPVLLNGRSVCRSCYYAGLVVQCSTCSAFDLPEHLFPYEYNGVGLTVHVCDVCAIENFHNSMTAMVFAFQRLSQDLSDFLSPYHEVLGAFQESGWMHPRFRHVAYQAQNNFGTVGLRMNDISIIRRGILTRSIWGSDEARVTEDEIQADIQMVIDGIDAVRTGAEHQEVFIKSALFMMDIISRVYRYLLVVLRNVAVEIILGEIESVEHGDQYRSSLRGLSALNGIGNDLSPRIQDVLETVRYHPVLQYADHFGAPPNDVNMRYRWSYDLNRENDLLRWETGSPGVMNYDAAFAGTVRYEMNTNNGMVRITLDEASEMERAQVTSRMRQDVREAMLLRYGNR